MSGAIMIMHRYNTTISARYLGKFSYTIFCTEGAIIMTRDTILDWNTQGVLSPIAPGDPVDNNNRSPYKVSLNDIVLRFNTSPERLNLLNGLLSFRMGLHNAGIVRGFQWLDGSFLECIESLECRAPEDIDVVTFYYLPEEHTQISFRDIYPTLFRNDYNVKNYHIDAYFINLGSDVPKEDLVSASAYWYSMWSHRRNALWKGYLQVDLSPTDDHIARDAIDTMMGGSGTI